MLGTEHTHTMDLSALMTSPQFDLDITTNEKAVLTTAINEEKLTETAALMTVPEFHPGSLSVLRQTTDDDDDLKSILSAGGPETKSNARFNNSQTKQKNSGVKLKQDPEPVIVPATSFCKQQYQCHLCTSVFSSRWNCVSHMRAHQRVRPVLQCPRCGKKCSKQSELDIHLRIHTGEKPFSCSVCRRSFARQGQLNSHMRSHSGVKSFLCCHCGASFVNGSNLKRHHHQLHAKHRHQPPAALTRFVEDEGNGEGVQAENVVTTSHRLTAESGDGRALPLVTFLEVQSSEADHAVISFDEVSFQSSVDNNAAAASNMADASASSISLYEQIENLTAETAPLFLPQPVGESQPAQALPATLPVPATLLPPSSSQQVIVINPGGEGEENVEGGKVIQISDMFPLKEEGKGVKMGGSPLPPGDQCCTDSQHSGLGADWFSPVTPAVGQVGLEQTGDALSNLMQVDWSFLLEDPGLSTQEQSIREIAEALPNELSHPVLHEPEPPQSVPNEPSPQLNEPSLLNGHPQHVPNEPSQLNEPSLLNGHPQHVPNEPSSQLNEPSLLNGHPQHVPNEPSSQLNEQSLLNEDPCVPNEPSPSKAPLVLLPPGSLPDEPLPSMPDEPRQLVPDEPLPSIPDELSQPTQGSNSYQPVTSSSPSPPSPLIQPDPSTNLAMFLQGDSLPSAPAPTPVLLNIPGMVSGSATLSLTGFPMDNGLVAFQLAGAGTPALVTLPHLPAVGLDSICQDPDQAGEESSFQESTQGMQHFQDTGQILEASDSQDAEQILEYSQDAGQILEYSQDTGQILEYSQDTGQILEYSQDTGQILEYSQDTGQILEYSQAMGQALLDQSQDSDQLMEYYQESGQEEEEDSQDLGQVAGVETALGEAGAMTGPIIIILEHPHGAQTFQTIIPEVVAGADNSMQVTADSLSFTSHPTLLQLNTAPDIMPSISIHGHDYTHTDHPPPRPKKIQEKSFACDLCPRQFARKWYLTVHRKAHLRQKAFTCQVCQATFTRVGNLNRHKLVHTGHKPFQCQHCTARFANRYRLAAHERRHDKVKLYSCDICHNSLSDLSSLRRHQKTHQGEGLKYVCDICGASFKTMHSLTFHLKVHVKEEGFGVTVEDVAFTPADVAVVPFDPTENNLHATTTTTTTTMTPSILKVTDPGKNNNKQQQQQDSYRCSVCHKTFRFSAACRQHIFSHLGARPYRCMECGATFSRKACARRHTQTHRRLKKNVCGQCGERFQTKPQLLLHQDEHLPSQERTLGCDQCDLRFSQERTLSVHRKIFHRQMLCLYKPGVGVVPRQSDRKKPRRDKTELVPERDREKERGEERGEGRGVEGRGEERGEERGGNGDSIGGDKEKIGGDGEEGQSHRKRLVVVWKKRIQGQNQRLDRQEGGVVDGKVKDVPGRKVHRVDDLMRLSRKNRTAVRLAERPASVWRKKSLLDRIRKGLGLRYKPPPPPPPAAAAAAAHANKTGHQTNLPSDLTRKGSADSGHETGLLSDPSQNGCTDSGYETELAFNPNQKGDVDSGHQTELPFNPSQKRDADSGHQTELPFNPSQKRDADSGHQTELVSNPSQKGGANSGHQSEPTSDPSQRRNAEFGHQTKLSSSLSQKGNAKSEQETKQSPDQSLRGNTQTEQGLNKNGDTNSDTGTVKTVRQGGSKHKASHISPSQATGNFPRLRREAAKNQREFLASLRLTRKKIRR